MIEESRLRDLGVIAEAILPLGPGFTAITGETGAGKTMVVTGLGLLLGERADSGSVRTQAGQASVAGVWLVPTGGEIERIVTESGGELERTGNGDAELYVSRTVTAEGRSRASVGGKPAPASVLAALAEELVVMHGQSDQLRLRSASAQREALDRFGGSPITTARERYAALWERWRALDEQLRALRENVDRRKREADDLRATLAQLDEVAPQAGEDVTLAARAERLANAEELRLAAAQARELITSDDDALDAASLIGSAERLLTKVSDPALSDIAGMLADVGYRAAEAAGRLAAYLADLDESGPHELATVEERRAQLGAIIRAHGSLDAAIELWQTGAERLAELDDDDDRADRLSSELADVRAELDDAAATLTAARTTAARALGEAVSEELHALAMPDARVEVAVTAGNESVHGRDDVALLLTPHPGAAPRPVSRGASGGELSRVMLAIEVVISAADPVPTFVFDEVDAGIGGAAAIEVGRRLARLAESAQVIVVTHLAQVAAFASNHLRVEKSHDGQVTASSVRQLQGAEREAEMARLLSGMADSDAALTHARELLGLNPRMN
jgi:DNA repair protein RecN (Recombination protein N)